MTTDYADAELANAITHIRKLDNVRRVSVSDNARRVAVSAAVDLDGGVFLSPPSERLFLDIEERLFAFGFFHADRSVDESGADACDFDAVEVWIFVRA